MSRNIPTTNPSEPTTYVPITDSSMNGDRNPRDFNEVMNSLKVLNKYVTNKLNLKMDDQLRHDIICEGINSLFEKIDEIGKISIIDNFEITINHRCYEIRINEWDTEILNNETKQRVFKFPDTGAGGLKNSLYRAIFGEYSAGLQHKW